MMAAVYPWASGRITEGFGVAVHGASHITFCRICFSSRTCPLGVIVEMDVLSHFGELDELIQVIYQGFDRFIVLSTVAESSWTICLGLKGPEGRWWRGSWSARDITQFVVRPIVYFRRLMGMFRFVDGLLSRRVQSQAPKSWKVSLTTCPRHL